MFHKAMDSLNSLFCSSFVFLLIVLSPLPKLLYVYIYTLKTELRISHFQHFHWLAGHWLSAHIPALPIMVN